MGTGWGEPPLTEQGAAQLQAWRTTTRSPGETRALGRLLGKVAKPQTSVCLIGDLGAGKTTFVQGLAEGLGISGPVTSPTFTIVSEYQGRLPLYHADVYRLGEAAAEEPLGLEEYFEGNGVAVVEWAEWVEPLLPDDRLTIRIERAGEANARVVDMAASGPRHRALLREVIRRWSDWQSTPRQQP